MIGDANAGSTGLNLQAANSVINVDLPWNPAVLEQRIGRVHRMGQKRPVQVFLLVTEESLEESLLTTLSAKQELFLATLDPDYEGSEVDLSAGMDELRRRLEVLLGAKPDAPPDESLREEVEKEAERFARRERVAEAGGQLLSGAFAFIGDMFPDREETERTRRLPRSFKERLSECLFKGEEGEIKMTVTLPDESALDTLAKSLARLVGD